MSPCCCARLIEYDGVVGRESRRSHGGIARRARILNVHSVPAGFDVQLSARSGSMNSGLILPGRTRTRPLNIQLSRPLSGRGRRDVRIELAGIGGTHADDQALLLCEASGADLSANSSTGQMTSFFIFRSSPDVAAIVTWQCPAACKRRPGLLAWRMMAQNGTGEPHVVQEFGFRFPRPLLVGRGTPGRPSVDVALPRRCDVAIIGAGYADCRRHLTLARAGKSVVVLDAAAPGWGASSRSGGMIGHGHRRS